ncbi:DNA-3-methyladenine glycosylase I [Pacificispira sp.]|uniref:DNA-3-methyladenine glycosylase I n=1 Tax=Pacificispira sp. TaxID=2888761 RepID=UPI002EC6BF4D|nr:DNA-3-methyladenine glycosylase I [Pseudomonadota bacterium]
MRSFDEIFAIAADRHGGADALKARLPKPATDFAAIPDDRVLAQMTRCIFQAGFHWKVIDQKWPGFEEAFHGFDPNRCAMIHDEEIDTLLSDPRIVRNPAKVKSVPENAAFILSLAKEHGSAAKAFAAYPQSEYIELLDLLKKKGSRLGGVTGQRVLRNLGLPAFILSNDVLARLKAEGVIDGPATSKKAQQAIQAAFNTWSEESGLSLSEISAVLAMSIDSGA